MKDLPFELVDSTSSLPFEVVGTIAPPPVAGLTDPVGNLPGEAYNPLSTAERERPTVDPNWYAQATPEQRRLANRAITEAQGQWNPLQEAHNDIAGESLILDGMPASGATERVVRRAVTGTGGLLEKLQRNAVGDWEGLQRATEHKLMAAQGSASAAESWVEGIAGGAAESLSKAAMFAPLGGPAGIIAAFVYDSTTDALEEARQAGLEGGDIAKYAAGIGVLEGGIAAAFQTMGLGGFESMFKSAGWGGVKEASKQMLAEVAEEEITAFSQAALSVLEGVNPDALRNPGQLAIDTAAATVLAMGTVQGSKAAVDFVSNPSRRTAKAAGVDGVAQNQKQRDKLTADAKKIIEHKQYAEGFRQQLADVAEAGRMTPEQARYLYYLTEARAKASGESLGEYLQSRGVRVENAKWEDFANKGNRRAIDESQSQKSGQLRRNAEIEFTQEGETVVRAFETATFNSMIHELGHLFRRDLAGKEMDAGARWAGAKKRDGEWVWSRDAEEKFARGFERYMTDGTAPSKPLGRLFEKIAGWMRNVYASLRREAPDVNISPEMRGVYDSLFLGADVAQDAMQAAPAMETQATPEAPQEAAQEPTASLADEALLDRFRGLANHSVNPVARAANYAVDEAMGMPDRKTWADAEAAARQRIQADPAGELQRALAKIAEAERTDGTVDLSDMTETAVFNRLKEAASLDIANPESRRIHKKIHESFRKARTEQARALGYRDPLNTPQQRKRRAITDAIATMDDDAEIQKIIDKLKGMGIDLTDLDSLIVDPHKTMITLDHFRKSQKFSDKLYEYWRNAILSGLRTQVTNIGGNVSFASYVLGPERLAESLVNVLVRDPKAAQLGEFKYMLAGVWPGIQRGVRNAVKAWSLETSALSEELGAEGQYKVAEGARGAIPGKLGRFIRAFGYRPLLAADEFSKSITVTMEAGAHAYRAGKSLGLEGEQLSQFIAEQVDDLSSPVWDVALEKAHELAFQSDKGVVTQALTNLGNKARSVPGVRWVVPFVQTPASIVEEGLRRTPVLGAVLDYAEMRRQGAGIADLNLSSTLARQVIALAATAILWDAVDDDDGWITGAAQTNDPKSREAAYRGQPPQSIKIGDTWYSYARIEPFATAVSFVVDTIRGAKYGGTSGAVREALYSPGNQIQNKSFLEGLSSLQEFVEDFRKRDEAAMARFAGRFATSFMPNIYRQIMSADTPEMDENRVWGKAPDVYKQILKRVAQQSQIPGVDTTQRYDLWGRPIQYHNEWSDNAIGTVGSFLQSLLSPIRTKRVTSLDEVDRALLQWNSQHPEEAVVWSEPPKYDRYKGETHYLSDEQYAEFAKLAGTLAAERVLKMNVNDIRPTKHQIEKIKDAVTRGRAIARSRLRPKWRESWSEE